MNILIVGVGGIGSYLTKELYNLIVNQQIDIDDNTITLMDFDKVEIKNLKYQDFVKKDIGDYKAKILSKKYCFSSVEEKLITEEQLKEYDFIICCVDNSQTRKLIYEHCNFNDIYFIDCRAEGRAIAIFTKHKTNSTLKLLSTLNLEKTTSSSCQLPHELEKNILQQGNKIVALICSQLVLNKLRNEENNPEYIFYF